MFIVKGIDFSVKILAIESSAGPASCAVWEERCILASAAVNTALTHSQTLLPMVSGMLSNAGLTLTDIDAYAVSAGPGSFTGIRIGVSAVKGMAFSDDRPCFGVSTLAAIARNADGLPFDGVVCAVMDARCQQVYSALFACRSGELTRLSPDAAISLEDLKKQLNSVQKPILMVGDGAQLCYNTFQAEIPALILAPAHLLYQQAAGVAREAAELMLSQAPLTHQQLQPVYLRLPQAERELRRRQAAQEDMGV